MRKVNRETTAALATACALTAASDSETVHPGRRQKFPRVERPLTGMTDAAHTGSGGSSGGDDDWNASPGHQSGASGERSWKPRPQANPSFGQAPP